MLARHLRIEYTLLRREAGELLYERQPRGPGGVKAVVAPSSIKLEAGITLASWRVQIVLLRV